MLSDASPAMAGSLDHEFYRGRESTHGYEATREAAMWQVGTNSVLCDIALEPHVPELREGLERLKRPAPMSC